LPQRQDADARQRERVRLVLAADRVGCRARRRGAVVEFAQASVSAFEGEVAVEEIADAEAEAGVAALVAARGADALVGERVVEVAAAQAEAAAAEVDAAVPGAVCALRANHAGADRECDRRACNDGFLVHPCSFSVVVSASAPGEGSIAARRVKAGHLRVKLSKKKAPGYYAPPAAIPQQQGYWYFCQSANAYYPYVQQCPEGWQPVVPVPPS